MTTINPVQTPVTQAPAFRGKNKLPEKLAKLIIPEAKKLTPEQTFMEKVAGMSCAANTKDAAILKEIILRETALGNLNFVKGINDYLARNSASKVYKK